MDRDSVRRIEAPPQTGSPEKFEGAVELEPVLDQLPHGPRHARVRFHNGAHTRWHFHLGEQILYFVEGSGWVKEAGKDPLECVSGDIVYVPERTKHAHGARHGYHATHVAVTHGETVWEWDPRYNAVAEPERFVSLPVAARPDRMDT
jgi:quercetin dioxygenase-like cupin family protein